MHSESQEFSTLGQALVAVGVLVYFLKACFFNNRNDILIAIRDLFDVIRFSVALDIILTPPGYLTYLIRPLSLE